MHVSSSAQRVARPPLVRRSADETYRHYRLIAGQNGEGFSAVAYVGKAKAFIASGSGVEATIDELKAQIDHDYARRAAHREGGIPTRDELQLALALASSAVKGPVPHILEALRDGPTVAPDQIRRGSGVDEEELMASLLRLARKIAAILNLPLSKGHGSAATALGLIVERIEPGETFECAVWIFRADFVAAAIAHLSGSRMP